ncbi:hypothetical protein GIB67_021372 [Kingdonia uniflora]|uniref:Uncharacterized protein n=1 Tax=Kingdonia uniflora TaxID=39325 RepID=A0A7J7MCZ3_9MAGN|nr:hypothetical protein GIB67_021372 [Kingdonia uniflora]
MENNPMGGLQRSEVSFRRQGSSGLVWETRFAPGDPKNNSQPAGEGEEQQGDVNKNGDGPSKAKMERSHSNGGGRGYRTGTKVMPDMDPPSPKVSACGSLCGVFAKKSAAKTNPNNKIRSKTGKRKS